MEMQENIKLSIIIPHRNSPDLLKKLLLTIPDKKEIQTIVVDDHSNEDMKGQLYALKSSFNRVLFLENDTDDYNAGKARDIGLKYAKGEWLLFADSDDYFFDGFYEVIKSYFDSDYEIVFFPPISIDLDSGEQTNKGQVYSDYLKQYIQNPSISSEANLRYRWFVPWSKMIKSSLVFSCGITFDSVRVSNDVMFSVKTGFFAKNIAADKNEIYCVTSRKGSLTTQYDLATFEIRTQILIKRFHFLKDHITKQEFRAIEEYKVSLLQLQLILRRKYGWKVFLKYIKIFGENKMLIFDIRIFTCLKPWKWIKCKQLENNARKKYELKEEKQEK